MSTIRFIDLFAGVGGFRYGLESINRNTDRRGQKDTQGNKRQRFQPEEGEGVSSKKRQFNEQLNGKPNERAFTCVYSNEWDKYASQIYCKNFCGRGCLENKGQPKRIPPRSQKGRDGKQPNNGTKRFNGCIDTRDITTVNASEIPDHDLLCAGFPCQSFSIAGKRKGFEDTRGTMFFEIARILSEKRPRYLLLENVKGLLSHDKGKTFQTIIGVLSDLGYRVEWQVLNSKHFGVPQNRERVFIVGHLGGGSGRKVFPIGNTTGSNNEQGQEPREQISNTLRTGYSNKRSNETYVEEGVQIRRLTPTECERLQGFPDGWTEKGMDKDGKEVVISDTQRYRCLGNAVTTSVIKSVGEKLILCK